MSGLLIPILLIGLSLVVLLYFVLLNGAYFATSFFAFGALRRYMLRMRTIDTDELMTGSGAPPITLISPAFNEEATCVEATQSLLTLKYPKYEIIVVNDGSTDGTLARMCSAFDMEPAVRAPMTALPTAPVRAVYRSGSHPNLWLVDKANGGKADALNAALNLSRTPLFCAIDADSLLEPDALVRIVRAFLEDRTTVAAGGIVRIVNGCEVRAGRVTTVNLPHSLLARFQVLEYLRAFLAGRMGWGAMDCLLIISGAFGIFKRSVVAAAGGFAPETVGEDMELVVRLHEYCRARSLDYRISFVPDPVAWTEAPESLRVLARQRDRWQRGLIEALTWHSRMLFNPRYGRIGLIAYPYFYFLEMLGPVIELLGYVGFFIALAAGSVSWLFATAFLAVAVILGIALSVAAVSLEELSFRRYNRATDLVRLLWLAVAENFGYRQLVTYWRVRGVYRLLRRVRAWGSMEHKGFSTADN